MDDHLRSYLFGGAAPTLAGHDAISRTLADAARLQELADPGRRFREQVARTFRPLDGVARLQEMADPGRRFQEQVADMFGTRMSAAALGIDTNPGQRFAEQVADMFGTRVSAAALGIDTDALSRSFAPDPALLTGFGLTRPLSDAVSEVFQEALAPRWAADVASWPALHTVTTHLEDIHGAVTAAVAPSLVPQTALLDVIKGQLEPLVDVQPAWRVPGLDEIEESFATALRARWPDIAAEAADLRADLRRVDLDRVGEVDLQAVPADQEQLLEAITHVAYLVFSGAIGLGVGTDERSFWVGFATFCGLYLALAALPRPGR